MIGLILIIFFLGIFLNSAPVLAISYQPDLIIAQGMYVFGEGNGVYNSTAKDQTTYKKIESYYSRRFYLKIKNAGKLVDRFKITGANSDQYWTVQYFDSVNRDITQQVINTGWQSAPLTTEKIERFTVLITPKKGIAYGQEGGFWIKAESTSQPQQEDMVKAVLTIRFRPEEISSQDSEPVEKIQSSSSQPTTKILSDSEVLFQPPKNGQPDLQIKTSKENVLVGKNIFESTDSISEQNRIQTVGANQTVFFNIRLTNLGEVEDTFVLRGNEINFNGWVIEINNSVGKEITTDLTNDFKVKLASKQSQDYQIKIGLTNVRPTIDKQSYLFTVYSINDLDKNDTIKATALLDDDLDNDKVSDFYEIRYNLDPLNSSDGDLDPDNDDLINRQEYRLGTNPYQQDTDGDGLWDGAQIKATNLFLNGYLADHLIITGPVTSATSRVLANQSVNYVLINSINERTSYYYLTNEQGFIFTKLKEKDLIQNGKYILATMANSKKVDEDTFVISPYGKVVNKKTRQPISGITVYLLKCIDQSCQKYAQRITDQQGLYNSFMVPMGDYRLLIDRTEAYQSFISPIFHLNADLNYDILLKSIIPLWLLIIRWLILLLMIGGILYYLLRNKWMSIIAILRRKIVYQPDAQIRNMGEKEFWGDTIYNLNGLGQTKVQQVRQGEKAIFHIRLQNDGSEPDRLLVSSTRLNTGWQVKFFNVLTGGNDITSEIINQGWKTGVLGSGLTKDIRLEVQPEENNQADHQKVEIFITVSSLNDGKKQDVVKTIIELVEKSNTKEVEQIKDAEENKVLQENDDLE
ncbi:MAG: hypothetical protein KAS12_02080 [Candidatus Aenigmarchaeota archaeon]|nr:hypothetical protein [Candidatus Aenigmarchaeota archaeon]